MTELLLMLTQGWFNFRRRRILKGRNSGTH
jgi:hypothetical protein